MLKDTHTLPGDKGIFREAFRQAKKIIEDGTAPSPKEKKDSKAPAEETDGAEKDPEDDVEGVKEACTLQKKPSRIQKAFDKEVRDYRLSLFKYSYITNGRINAQGRVFFKVMALLLSLIYLVTDTNLVEVVTYIALMSLVLPLLIDIVSKLIVERQEIREGNLYDMLYAFGLYIITLTPAVGLLIFAMKKVKEAWPGIYDSFSGIPLYICIAAAAALAIDVICMGIAKIKAKKCSNL